MEPLSELTTSRYRDECFRILKEDAILAQRATRCRRRGTAARIVNEVNGNTLRAINGPSRGWSCSGILGDCGCVHAETRLIVQLLRLRITKDDGPLTLFSTLGPCTRCAHLLVECERIDKIRWLRDYHDRRGVAVLKSAGIDVRRCG